MNIPSYSSIYNLGHRAIADLLKSPVRIEEKIDGSQFSFSLGIDGELRFRSKGAQLNTLAPEKMFARGVEYIKSVEDSLVPGLVYRGEYLAKPKHNTLAYARTPKNHIMLFDILRGEEDYVSDSEKAALAEAIGLEVVPKLFEGLVTDATQLREYLDRESVLGGQKIEGVVVKPAAYNLFGIDKKLLIGKFVSEAFKEAHGVEWKKGNPGPQDVISVLSASLTTPARWQKALIHLREAGKIEDSPRDIGALVAEVPKDVLKECEGEIKEQLFKWAWPQLRRRITSGLPEWYKEELAKAQFEKAA